MRSSNILCILLWDVPTSYYPEKSQALLASTFGLPTPMTLCVERLSRNVLPAGFYVFLKVTRGSLALDCIKSRTSSMILTGGRRVKLQSAWDDIYKSLWEAEGNCSSTWFEPTIWRRSYPGDWTPWPEYLG